MTAWSLAYDTYDPAEEGQREALCTLGNGFFATRGAAPESRADRVHNPGTYAAGCYNRLKDDIAGQHLAGLETTITALNWSGRLRVRSGIDGSVENTGVKRYRNLSSRHLSTFVAEPRGDDLLLLVAETTQSHIRVAVAARNRVVCTNPAGGPEWRVVHGPDSVAP